MKHGNINKVTAKRIYLNAEDIVTFEKQDKKWWQIFKPSEFEIQVNHYKMAQYIKLRNNSDFNTTLVAQNAKFIKQLEEYNIFDSKVLLVSDMDIARKLDNMYLSYYVTDSAYEKWYINKLCLNDQSNGILTFNELPFKR